MEVAWLVAVDAQVVCQTPMGAAVPRREGSTTEKNKN